MNGEFPVAIRMTSFLKYVSRSVHSRLEIPGTTNSIPNQHYIDRQIRYSTCGEPWTRFEAVRLRRTWSAAVDYVCVSGRSDMG